MLFQVETIECCSKDASFIDAIDSEFGSLEHKGYAMTVDSTSGDIYACNLNADVLRTSETGNLLNEADVGFSECKSMSLSSDNSKLIVVGSEAAS